VFVLPWLDGICVVVRPEADCPDKMETPENILVIRLKSIGDVLFTLPAVQALHDNFPSARIIFLTSRENAPLLLGFREVNDVIVLDRTALRNPFRCVPEIFRLLRRLRSGKFSKVIDFQGYGETAWLSWWSGAPERWGSVYGPGRRWAYTRGLTRIDKMHPAEWNLSLLQQCGLQLGRVRNDYVLPAAALTEAEHFFKGNNLDASKTTLYLQPFTSSPPKNWPLENFLALARFWRARGLQIIFSGGPGDRPQLEPAQADGFTVAAGVPRLTDAGLMKLSTVVVGGDTGFLHLAVALGKRVVMIRDAMLPGSPHPYQHPDWVVTPAAGKTIQEIEIGAVIAACAAAMENIQRQA